MSDPQLPKASLYVYKRSIWSAVPLLALEEKGYGPDEVIIKQVDLSEGDNFTPSYLRVNHNGTVPTLVVPLSTTLDPEIESRYKAIRDTKACHVAIVEFLDKSRSPQSHTHTTSAAPAPVLAPATIAFVTASNKVIELLHSDAGNPNELMWLNARDDSELAELSAQFVPFLTSKIRALDELIEGNKNAEVKVSEKTVLFWENKRLATMAILDVLKDGAKGSQELDASAQLKRDEYFKAARSAWFNVRDVFMQLHKEMIGPYVLGDQLSVADLHLAAWLARLAMLSGATASDDGNTIVRKIEAHVGNGFGLPKDFSVAEARRRSGLPTLNIPPNERQSRFAAFWDAMKERSSWKKVYADDLH
ncbi:hypothetical protein NM688_g702 [Phlebia brevispora]|uniref:Uncharacterized protein n=1 Tax=Phlebia brevispora TaxID=194682 RepID=A0ACC1TDU5_9APHY|nr:hypothetical protein NM688_g702 [Phlebia brevispora]